MTVFRHPHEPQIFCPLMARDHGLTVAVVEYATRSLSRGTDPETNEEINAGFKMSQLLEKCFYLTEKEVKDALKVLVSIGDCTIDGPEDLEVGGE